MIEDILRASIAVAAASGILAAVISVIDAFVNNYGEVRIDINSGKKKLTVKGGAPLLSTLAQEGIFIPSSCGGRATCGVCRVKVLSDAGPLLPTETPFISGAEQKSGTRLSCQVKVKKDIAIEIPESLFAVRRYKTRVSSVRDLCHDTKEVRLSLKEPDAMDFTAGQFAQIVIPPHDKIREETVRAYSISSSPTARNDLEFIIRLVPQGIATTYVHTRLAVGNDIDIIGPMGYFCAHENNGVMICISGGSGMAPFKSIIPDLKEHGSAHNSIWYFHGANSMRDLYNMEFFRELEKNWPLFHFVPVLFRPQPQDNWNGETGLVTDAVLAALEKSIPKGHDRDAYLCGSPGMIDASIVVLKSAGIDDSRIYFDKFS